MHTEEARADIACKVRGLIRRARSAALATIMANEAGRPYASLVTVATDTDGSPVLLFSDLSDHTQNLKADPRAGLLLEEASRRANPQTGARVTLIGRIEVAAEPRLKRRFLARHPGAIIYAGFADFNVYRMQVERAHFVGGFGRAQWLDAAPILCDAAASAAIAAAEPVILDELRADAAIGPALARHLTLRGDGWQVIAVDPEGADLRRRSSFARFTLPRPAADDGDLRRMLRGHAFAAACG